MPTLSDWVALDELTGAERWRAGLVTNDLIIQDGLYVLGGSELCVLDGVTGTLLWCSAGRDQGGGMSPALVDRNQGNVYATSGGSGGEHLVALDINTGSERWRLEAQPRYESPAHPFVFQVFRDLALVWDPEQRIVAVKAKTGAEQWRSTRAYWLPDAVIDDGVIWAVGRDERLVSTVALDVGTGEERWSTPFGQPTGLSFFEAMVDLKSVMGDTVYVMTSRYSDSTFEHTLRALNASTGTQRWQRVIENEHRNWSGDPYVGPGHRLASQARFDSFGATTGSVYLGDSKYLYALDPIHGVERWRFRLSAPDDYASTSPSVGTFGVYVEDHGHLSMLDPVTGEPQWVFERSVANVRFGCRVCHEAGEVVYVISADNALYALNARTGGVRDRFAFAPAPSATALFEPLLERIRRGYVRSAEGDAKLLRKHAATAQAAAVLSSVEHRLGAYRHHSLSEEERTTELTAIGALLDLLRPRSDLVDQSVANKSGKPLGSVFHLLSPIPVKVEKDALYLTTHDAVYALRVSGSQD
ncbi:MAG: PQQ-binding-like beta-propeller repeat protein [Chloroflexota bacterium]|nr:PQQ-binding-like beta-propeller repeat protein [Chloroflexota bacterium]